MDFLLSNGSGNHILLLNENTFPNETWHVVRTFVGLQSCVWGMSKAENCGYGRLDFRRSFVSGPPLPSGEEHGLISRTAAGNRAYGYGGHRNLRYEKNNKNCLYLFGNFRYWIPQTQIFALFDEE